MHESRLSKLLVESALDSLESEHISAAEILLLQLAPHSLQADAVLDDMVHSCHGVTHYLFCWPRANLPRIAWSRVLYVYFIQFACHRPVVKQAVERFVRSTASKPPLDMLTREVLRACFMETFDWSYANRNKNPSDRSEPPKDPVNHFISAARFLEDDVSAKRAPRSVKIFGHDYRREVESQEMESS